MKISIITVVFNGESTIRDTIHSVLSQDYPDIEHIIIDGASTDGTLNIIKMYSDRLAKVISEPDSGIYDAMNKGLRLASGDVIGILNSDDFYADTTVISSVVKHFEQTQAESVFGDLVYVTSSDRNKVIRYYSSAKFNPDQFAYGWMPAHPTFFVKRWAYERYGLFKTDYKIAADYELLTRFLAKHRLSYSYLPKIMVKMRAGGVSTTNLKSNWILNREIIRGCAENNIQTNMPKVLSKYFTKVFQLVARPT
ncbi:glycosyltransferase family 2 protein [Myxacorys almedinensis]|uniref:Glycosyltransferase n=1 Tax=Myxacorys almedinensis A TaxID=2690445 RepID=A0A8J7ZB43_9CYAN|nr:glycosyltransferase family 2 protein [Myxacorys almedinensis]NDJ18720.1 glycosyltransferase [Myxacorys almedinensis A]